VKLILPVEIASEIQLNLPLKTQIVCVDCDGNLSADASDAEIYFNWFNLKPTTLHKVLAASPKLRWQHTPSAGVNHILTPTFLAHDIVLTNSAGVHAIPVAEFALAFMLYHAKHLGKLQAAQALHQWRSDLEMQELTDTTVLIIGAGGIGCAMPSAVREATIASRAKAFGMQVWGSRRHPQPLPNFDLIVGANEWRVLLPQVDYVVIATPLTPETKKLIDTEALQNMRESAYLINIARGAVVDETALITALKAGWISGAGLDTFYTEPLPPDNPLWTLPNVFITPHCSGNSPKVIQRCIALFLENLQHYLTQKPLINVVDKIAGY